MPGVLGGVLGAISAAASDMAFGDNTSAQYNAFSAMIPVA